MRSITWTGSMSRRPSRQHCGSPAPINVVAFVAGFILVLFGMVTGNENDMTSLIDGQRLQQLLDNVPDAAAAAAAANDANDASRFSMVAADDHQSISDDGEQPDTVDHATPETVISGSVSADSGESSDMRSERRDEVELELLNGHRDFGENIHRELDEDSQQKRKINAVIQKRGSDDGESPRRRNKSRSRHSPTAMTVSESDIRDGRTTDTKVVVNSKRSGVGMPTGSDDRQRQEDTTSTTRRDDYRFPVETDMHRGNGLSFMVGHKATPNTVSTDAYKPIMLNDGEGKTGSSVRKTTNKTGSRTSTNVDAQARTHSRGIVETTTKSASYDQGRIAPKLQSKNAYVRRNETRNGKGRRPLKLKLKPKPKVTTVKPTTVTRSSSRDSAVQVSKSATKAPTADIPTNKSNNQTISGRKTAGRYRVGLTQNHRQERPTTASLNGRKLKQPIAKISPTVASPTRTSQPSRLETTPSRVSSVYRLPVAQSARNSSKSNNTVANGNGKNKPSGVQPPTLSNRTRTNTKSSSSSARKSSKTMLRIQSTAMLGNEFQSDASWNRSQEAVGSSEVQQLGKSVADVRPRTTCDELKCAAGGLCIEGGHRPGTGLEREARCSCQLGTTGPQCEQEVAVKYPKFSSTSYIVLPMFASLHKDFTLKMQFRPDSPGGLLLYGADGPTHFFSASLVEGYVEFRFDFGAGTGIIRTKNTVMIGRWNALRLERTVWNTYVRLNDGPSAKGEPKQFGWTYTKNSYGNYQWNYVVNHTNNFGPAAAGGFSDNYGASKNAHDQHSASKLYSNSIKSNHIAVTNTVQFVKPKLLHEDIFIGGHGDLMLVENRTGVGSGLMGCVRQMRGHGDLMLVENRTGVGSGLMGCVRQIKINDRDYDMRKTSPSSYIGDALYGLDIVECNSAACTNLNCINGGRCAAVGADTSVCMCPLGTAGEICQSKVDVKLPSFSGQSYLQYIGLRRSVLLFTDILIVFRTTQPDALLLYNGYTTDGSPGDFLSLAINNRTVVFQFDLGSGPATLRSVHQVSLNDWHTVHVIRSGASGTLHVDDQPEVKGASGGPFTQLTLALDLFIGGHRNFDEVPRAIRADRGLRGCIQKVVINEHKLKLIDEAIGGINVDNCSPHPCAMQPSPCQNGGLCVPSLDRYQCECSAGFGNTNCQDKLLRYRYRFF